MLVLEKKVVAKARQPTMKATFKDEPKKKTSEATYGMEGLQNVFKTMSNKMVELKKPLGCIVVLVMHTTEPL